MKKIIIFFIMLFIFIAAPVKASEFEDNNFDAIYYQLESKKIDDEKVESGFGFWGLLFIAFVSISVFLIAYKSDDDLWFR